MRYTITGRNIEVTQGLREAVEDKLGKLEKYFTPDTEAVVTLSVQRELQKIEVTIPVKGSIIRAEESSTDMYVSIDLVEEIIERQIKKYRKKLIDMKPMYPEDACLEMELLGHNFYMFLNAETDQISVVYKRKANSYGLIEPEA